MGLIGSLIIGALAGWLASMVMKTNAQQGLLMDIVFGVVGGWVGGLLFNLIGIGGDGIIMQLVGAVIGACALIFGFKAIMARR